MILPPNEALLKAESEQYKEQLKIYFAAAALIGLIAKYGCTSDEVAAKAAWKIADMMVFYKNKEF